jgi:hypothetical protein
MSDFLTPLDMQRIMLFSALGMPLGMAGATLASTLGNLKTKRELLAEDDPEKIDDNVLYVNMPRKAAADGADLQKATIPGTVLAGSGALLSLIGTYQLTRKLYQQEKLKELQKELDEEQNLWTSGLAQKTKRAGAGAAVDPSVNKRELAFGFPIAAALLTALGSGVITNRVLDNIFPEVNKKDITDGPPRVVFRQTPPEEADEEERAKYASDRLAVQSAMSLALEFSKKAADSDFLNLVAAVAAGRGEELEQAVVDGDGGLIDVLVKGAAAGPLPRWKSDMAVNWLSGSAALGPSASILAMAEIGEALPAMSKLAADMDTQDADAADYAVEAAGMLRWARLDAIYKVAMVKELPGKLTGASRAVEHSLAPGEKWDDLLMQDIFMDEDEDTDDVETPLDTQECRLSTASEDRV